jgi:release factor glutamine methyltransferase
LAVAAENARRLIAGDAFCLESDLFDRIEGKFRLITANPPYIPQDEIAFLSREVQGEPRLALDGGADGLGVIRRLIAGAPRHLLPGGRLFIEADPRQMSLIRELLGAYRDLRTYPDLAGNPRVIAASLP